MHIDQDGSSQELASASSVLDHSPTSLQADVPWAMKASSPTLGAFLFDGRFKPAHDSAMHTIQLLKRGGRRIGAGRPKGTYEYGEPTVPVRVPAKLVSQVKALCSKAPRKVPLFVMVNLTKPLN
jgi:hypothetical protein